MRLNNRAWATVQVDGRLIYFEIVGKINGIVHKEGSKSITYRTDAFKSFLMQCKFYN